MASQSPKENAKRNKNAIPGTLGQIDSEEGNVNNDDQLEKDNVESSEDNLPGVVGGSKDPIAEGTPNEEKLGDDDAEGESSSPQRTEYGPQGEASHSKGKPGMGNIFTHTGDHQDSLAMSFDYKDSMGSSMVNVFKPLHVPGINTTVTQDKTEIDDQRSSSSESFEVINKFDTERDGDDKEESEDGETEGQGEFDTDMSGGDQASAGPIGNMAPGDHSNNHKPDLCEAAEFQVIKKLGRYFLRDSKGKQSVLPQEIRYGPKFSIDGNLILDENENIFEIVKYENGRFHFKAISEGKVDNEESKNEGKSVTNSGDETQTMSSMPISFSDKNTTVENYRAHAVQRRNSVGEHQGSTRRQTPVDGNEAMPEHGRESVVGPPSSTYINQGQTKTNIQQTSGMNMGNTKTNSSQQTAGSRNAGYQEQTLETKPDKSKTVRDNPEATENDPMKTTNLAETSNTDSKKFNASVHKTSVDGKDVVVKEDLTELQQYTDNGNNSDDPTSQFHGTSSDDEGSSTQASRKDADVDADTPPERPPKTVLGAGCQDAAATGHSASKAMLMFPVEVTYHDERGQPAPVKSMIDADFEKKMKMMYVIKQHPLFTKKRQKIEDKMKAEVDFRNGTFFIKGVTFGCIDTALAEMTAIILEDTDNLVLNAVPVTGLDGEEVCSSILKSKLGQIGKIYPYFDQEKTICWYVYEKDFARQVEECINSSVKKMMEERDASTHTSEQITLSIVFSEVFNADGMEVKLKKYHPQVTCEMKDCKTEDLLIIQLSGDENKVKDAQLWIETEYEHKFAVNHLGFKEVKQGEKVGDELSEIVERKCLFLKEKKSILFFYISSETSQITICTTDQTSADLATNSLKKCLKEKEFDTDNISKPEKIKTFKLFAKTLEQDNCIVTIKGNKVCVFGLKDDVERAEKCFHDILKEIQEITKAKEPEYQPISDDSKTSQQLAQSIENKLAHTTHKTWQDLYGHAVMVAKATAKEFWEEVYVEFEVQDKSNQADPEPEFQQHPEAKYTVSLKIPQWQGGERKEKHRVGDQFQRLLKSMKEKDAYKATVQMCSYGNWPQNTLMKQILKPLNQQKTVPLEILFCYTSDDDYQSVCSVCEEVFGKATVDNEVTTGPKVPTSKPLVTKVVTAQLDKYEVDVIVNSVHNSLDLSLGGVSKALSQRAGPDLQKEVNRLHPNKMDYWEIQESGGHRLNCKHVFHGALPSVGYDVERKVQELESFTFKCLRKAASLQCRSIAFPALGTGNLGFKPEDVAEAMFSAVDDFNTTYRVKSLEEVHFVLFYRKSDTNVIQAFQKQESLRDPRHVSKECIFGNVSLKVRLGTIERLRTDCVIYLWEKHHMHSVSPTLNAVLKHTNQDVIKKWITHRDSKGKSKDTAFSTAGGDLKIPILVHVPCSDDKKQLAQHFLKGLTMADNEKARRVVVYFDQAHPILTKHCRCIGEALVGAVVEYAPHCEYLRDISLMVEGKNSFTPLCQYFTNLTQPSATGGGENQVEPSRQEIFGRDGQPAPTGQAGLSGSQTQQGAETGKAQWNQSNLIDDIDLRRYVIVNGLPDEYKQKSLKDDLFRSPFPVRPPQVIYPQKSNKALLICWSVKDAETLVAYQGPKGFTFKLLDRQSLSNFNGFCRFEVDKKIILHKDELHRCLEGTGIQYEILVTQKKLVFKAPTLIQIQFAEEITSELIGISTPMRKKQSSTGEFQHVEKYTLSDTQWDILNATEFQLLQELKKDTQLAFDNGSLTISTDQPSGDPPQIWTKFEKVVIELQKKQTEEISIENTSDAQKWCDEICEFIGSKCCIYLRNKMVVIAFSETYDVVKKVKHQLMLKQGKIQQTGRRGRRNLAAKNESTTDANSSENKEKATGRKFDWEQDAQNLKIFETKEGIVVKVYNANILNLPVDCIVNAANESLSHGGGVAKVIADAAGEDLVQDGDNQVRIKGKIPVGYAYTTSAGNLKYTWVIHAVGPSWFDYQPMISGELERCEDDLRAAIKTSFYEAEKKNLSSIALPAISSAIFGVPVEICAYQYALATVQYSKGTVGFGTALKEIHFIDIKHPVIRKIQEMFKHVLVDDRRPYNIQSYVKIGSSPNRVNNQNDQFSSSYRSRENHTQGKHPTRRDHRKFVSEKVEQNNDEIQFRGKDHGSDFFFLGSGHQLILCRGDLFEAKADALVTVVNKSGSGHGYIAKQILQKCTDKRYKTECSTKFTYTKCTGDIVDTCGFNHDFKKVFHVVYPFEETRKPDEQRKISLHKTYNNIFKKTRDEGNVLSLSMVLLGTGQDSNHDIRLSTEAFAESYLNFCRKPTLPGLVVQLVCREDMKYTTVFNILNKAFDSQKRSQKQSPPAGPPPPKNITAAPGGYPHSKLNSDEKNSADGASGASKVPAADKTNTEEDEICVICMDTIDNPRELDCGHKFCTDCIEQSLKFKQVCPTCGKVCGVLTGDQPEGTMEAGVDYRVLNGYEGCGSIRIDYRFRSGRQEDHHPNPGKWYEGIQRSGFLPNNREGNIVLEMLRVAFDRKLVFTIGSSRTTGQEGVITWNDIHHKTNPNPHGKFGYPDPTYLERVTDELSAKGVTEKDIPEKTLAKINKRFQGRY